MAIDSKQGLSRRLDPSRSSPVPGGGDHWTDLLEILICPACRAKVEMKEGRTGLKCVACHRVYPIRDEIPVMLIDEAVIEE